MGEVVALQLALLQPVNQRSLGVLSRETSGGQFFSATFCWIGMVSTSWWVKNSETKSCLPGNTGGFFG